MINPAHFTVEKMVGYTHFGTIGLNSAGTAILMAFGRSANAAPMAFLALTPDEAKDHAADLMRMVIAVENNLTPEDHLAFTNGVVWHPFTNQPDSDRLVLITNEDWPETEKTTLGWFDEGCWYEQSGAWLDADPDSGESTMPPTHWAEMPRRATATSGSRP